MTAQRSSRRPSACTTRSNVRSRIRTAAPWTWPTLRRPTTEALDRPERNPEGARTSRKEALEQRQRPLAPARKSSLSGRSRPTRRSEFLKACSRGRRRRKTSPAATRQQSPTASSGSPNIRYAQSGLSPCPHMLSTIVHPYQASEAPTATRHNTPTARTSDIPPSFRRRTCGAGRVPHGRSVSALHVRPRRFRALRT
jgi:hypothetical protein